MLQVRCTRRHGYAGRLHVRAAAHRLGVWLFQFLHLLPVRMRDDFATGQ